MAWEVEGRVGEGGSAEEGGRWRRDLDGEVALMGSGRGGGVGELREVEAELMEGSVRAEGLRRDGSTVSLCSPAFKWTAVAF